MMGWISKRRMQTGSSLNTNKGKKISEKGPLRKIICVINHSDNMFVPDWVKLECGHEASAWGHYRARCTKCRQTIMAENIIRGE